MKRLVRWFLSSRRLSWIVIAIILHNGLAITEKLPYSPPSQGPEIINPGNQTGHAGDPISLPILAQHPDNRPLVYSATGLPEGLSINPVLGISGTIARDAFDGSPYNVMIDVRDPDGVGASTTFIWTVLEPRPYETLRFAVVGDFGEAGSGAEAVANMVKSWEPDIIITTGDNNYPLGSPETIDTNIGQYYHDYIFPYRGSFGTGAEELRFFPVMGNHDWDYGSAKPYFEYFELPGNERYYDFTWGPVHFFGLSADFREPDGIDKDSIQGEWAKERLKASEIPWQVVYLHEPPYTSAERGPTTDLRWPFKGWGADVVISGHGHVYERLMVDDMLYFINGVGGGEIQKFVEAIPESQFRFNDTYGAQLVTATECHITFEFFTIVNPDTPLDSYMLERC